MKKTRSVKWWAKAAFDRAMEHYHPNRLVWECFEALETALSKGDSDDLASISELLKALEKGSAEVDHILIGITKVQVGVLSPDVLMSIIRHKSDEHHARRVTMGRSGTQEIREAVKWAQQGFATAQFLLGGMYYYGYGVVQDYREAVKWWTLAAQQGYAKAQYNLGLMYHDGEGVETDVREAVKWWTLAAQQGHTHAQYHLGLMYHDGEGVETNVREAVKWWTLAAQQGHAKAQHHLGVMYYNGYGVEKDEAEAHKWLNLAVAQGDETARIVRDMVAQQMTPDQIAEAQYHLGVMYYNGFGVEKDYVTAHKWWTLAAQQGHATAQANLGVMYEKGYGVEKDYVTAYKWWTLAARSDLRDAMAQKMTPDQITEAERLAREWQARHSQP